MMNPGPDQSSNSETQPLLPPRNTYRQFLTSVSSLVHRLCDCIVIRPENSIYGPVPGSTDEQNALSNPSLTISGPFPAGRYSVLESTHTTYGSICSEEPGIPPSAPQAREELSRHCAFCDRSEGSVATHDISHNKRSYTPIPSESTQLQGAHGFSISGNPSFTNIGGGVKYLTHINNYGGSHGLEHVEKFVSFDALHNSAAQDPDRKCHPGTRIVVLTCIRNWIDDHDAAESVFWLHGPAGVGKSAIAQTIAHAYNREQVAATFFFFRSDPSRNDGNRLFITIAWQLAFSIPGIKEHIIRSLNNQPDLPRKDVETQFMELIVRPLQALKQASGHLPSPLVIIDGVDECADEKLQRRFLKVIGNAVKDNCVPARFLICSRPEAHIQETVDHFPDPKLKIDLAGLDDANHDIEKYLRDEFSRIACEQGLDSSTWPGDERIRRFVYKASGQFAYVSTVIKYVDDVDNSAVTQLDVILGLKPPSLKAPFAELDALYMEILERQPDRSFLITFLCLLIARLSIRSSSIGGDFHADDGMLMNVSEFELHRKLRRMRSLLKFDPHIQLHHRSFLDFLQDSSRSGRFYISEKNAYKRYLELITDSAVQFASRIIDQPNHHEAGHFCPEFRCFLRYCPQKINLPVQDWQEALQPLLRLQDKLLTLPSFTSTWNLLPCDTCTVFQITRDLLLRLAILQGRTCRPDPPLIQTVKLCSDDSDVIRSTDVSAEAMQHVHKDGICSLLIQLRNTKPESEPSVNPTTIKLICSLLDFDCAEVAKRVSSVADAQNLMDSIDSLINDGHFLSQDTSGAARQATRLALEIYARLPVLPQSLFSNIDISSGYTWSHHNITDFSMLCQGALLGRILDPSYNVPLLEIHEEGGTIRFVSDLANDNKSLREWRKTSNPSAIDIIQTMCQLAKAVQYLHSIGVLFASDVELSDIFLDSKLRAKFCYLYSISRYATETPSNYHFYDDAEKSWSSYENNVSIFGCLFYELYFDREIAEKYNGGSSGVSDRPSEPAIREDAWQLIQWCCTDGPKDRPTMDQVLQEMDSWNLA